MDFIQSYEQQRVTWEYTNTPTHTKVAFQMCLAVTERLANKRLEHLMPLILAATLAQVSASEFLIVLYSSS